MIKIFKKVILSALIMFFMFMTTTFAADIHDDNPGPGGYMIGSTNDGKAFPFEGKYP